jgi:hypothetical protein
VPGYAPGFPLTLAAFEKLFGARAVFWVVPLLGSLAVWATYLLGVLLEGRRTGLIAALLLATSPIFLLQLFSAMSDVPTTAWWTLCLVLIAADRGAGVLGAGLLAGVAVLTRPNLAHIALAPMVLIVWQCVDRRRGWRHAVGQLVLFSAAPFVAVIVVALLQYRWYGSPLITGYGPAKSLFELRHLGPNISRYFSWLSETQTPLVLVAGAVPFFVASVSRTSFRRPLAYALAVFVACVCLAYVFVEPFEDWSFLRFLLPAFPCLLVLAAAGLVRVCGAFPSETGRLLLLGLLAFLCLHGTRHARSHAVFDMREDTRQYEAIASFVGERLPAHDAVFALQHSGSVRYYSGRLTVRYDLIPPAELDHVIGDLVRAGYQPFFAVEDWEVGRIRRRFGQYSKVAALDWPPLMTVDNNSHAGVYALKDYAASHLDRDR